MYYLSKNEHLSLLSGLRNKTLSIFKHEFLIWPIFAKVVLWGFTLWPLKHEGRYFTLFLVACGVFKCTKWNFSCHLKINLSHTLFTYLYIKFWIKILLNFYKESKLPQIVYKRHQRNITTKFMKSYNFIPYLDTKHL